MSEIRVTIDVHTRRAEFSRTIHPSYVGDLDKASQVFEAVVKEIREWFERERKRP